MPSLYHLLQEHLALDAARERLEDDELDVDDATTDAVLDWMARFDHDVGDKMDAVHEHSVRTEAQAGAVDAEAAALQEEVDRMKARAKAKREAAARLQREAARFLLTIGAKKVTTDRATYTAVDVTKRTLVIPDSVRWQDLPDEFVKHAPRVSKSVDKDRVREWIEKGLGLPDALAGAVLEHRPQLRVR